MLKAMAAVLGAFLLLLFWTNQREAERHDPRRSNGEHDVLLLSASWCGYCKQERAALTRAGIPFREVDVEDDGEGRDAYRAVGGRGIPITVIGKDIVFGYDIGRLNARLGEHGYKASLH